MVPPPCDSSGSHAAPDTIAGAAVGVHPNSVVNAAPDNRDTTDARDLSPSRQRAKKCETKIVLLRLQAESPLLPIKEDVANNINHISVKSAANHHHLPYSACATDYQSPAHLTPGKRSVDIFLTPPTSCPPTPTPPTVFGTPSSECRRRSSTTSLHRFEGIIPTTTPTANGYATPTTDGLHPDTTITIVDHSQSNNNYNKIKNINNNNNNTPLYSNYNYNKPNAAGSPHTHDYNLYPNDTFERLAGPPPKVQTKMQSKVDAVGRVTGEWGRWQLRTVLLIFLVKIPSSWFMACIIFTAPAPRHGEFFCKPPHTVGAQNQTQWIKVSHPQKEELDDQEFAIDFCNVYQDAQEHAHRYYHYDRPELEPKLWEEPEARSDNIIPCTQFQHEADFHSIVTQYDLVCSRDILVSVTQFFHLFGVLTGGILANHLLKYFSPRYVMLFGMVTQIFCGNLTGHVSSYELHVFFRCLSAVCCAQMYTAGGMIMADITGGKYKTCVSTLFEQFWSIGVIMLPGVASFFSSWSHLYMAISWPTVILIYLWQWIPDSPRWMINRGRVLDAKKILLDCADVNGTRSNLPRDIDQQLELQAQTAVDAPPPSGWWSLWKGEKAVRHIVCVHLAWSIYIVVYYGMLLNIRSFSRDHLEINTVVAGLCEIIGTFIGLFLILKTTRKWLWTGLFNVIAGFIAFLGWLVPDERQIDFDARVALLMLSAMISKTAISTTLSILTTCTVELVSDDKKKICAFSTICWARFWLLGAPFIGATLIFGQLVPQTAFAALAIIGGVLTALISSPRTISKQKSTQATSNMATATQFSNEADIGVGIYNKGFANGTNNPIFTSITKLSAPHSNLPPQMMPGIWTTKNHEDCPPI